MIENISYEHKLVVGKNAFINIKIGKESRDEKTSLSIIGGCRNSGGQCSDSLKEMFDKNPDNLYIPKADFDKLMEIWEGLPHFTYSLSDDDSNFLQSLKTSQENQKIEDALESHDSFSVDFNGQTIFLDSSLNGRAGFYEKKHNVYNIEFRIDGTDETVISFKYHDSVHNYNQGKESLSRRDVLNAFRDRVENGCFGSLSFKEFKNDYCPQDEDENGEIDEFWRKQNIRAYKTCQNAKSQLEDINDIEDLNITLRETEFSDFTGWVVEDAEVKKSATLKM